MKNLRRIRKAKKMTQKRLAELADVTESAISQYESGKKTPSFETALKIAEALDCESADLVSERDIGFAESEQGIKKAATIGDDLKVSKKDKDLVMWFRSLPEEKQKAILISQDAPSGLL